MTYALAVSSGINNLGAAVPVRGRTSGPSITAVAVLTAMNLCGVRESGLVPAVLTYLWMCREAGALFAQGRLGGTVACRHGRGYVVAGVPGSLVGEHEEADHGGNAAPRYRI